MIRFVADKYCTLRGKSSCGTNTDHIRTGAHHVNVVRRTCLLLALQANASQFPAQRACSGGCEGYVHDPAVIVGQDGKYYRFVTNNKITIATVPAITGPWESQDAALPNGSVIDKPGNDDLWVRDKSKVSTYASS